MNSMEIEAAGAVGIVTEGNCRDTDEVIMQKTPVACGGIGRPIIPGRTEIEEVQTTVSLGGVLVRPGDIVGCDWDGVVVVPLEIAEDVLLFAARIASADICRRRSFLTLSCRWNRACANLWRIPPTIPILNWL